MKTKFNFRFLALTLAGIFVSLNIWAQDLLVKGVVNDAFGDPVTGANVVIKGTTVGTITDLDGNFTMKAPKGSTLLITFIGYKAQEVPASANVRVTLAEDSELLDDVVVIGYGSVKKNDMTGSVTAIKPDNMNKGLVISAQDALQGKIAGVNITNDGGSVGGGTTIRIRGGSSLNASNDPLIVIDGLALDNYGLEGAGNPLSMVNPNDIESYTVLKDASATAIYGSRASNGVIIITTKKGLKNTRPRVAYNGNVSVSTIKDQVSVMKGGEDGEFVNFIKGIVMAQKGFTTDDEWKASEEYKNLGYYNANGDHLFANTDWQDELFRTGVSTDHNVTVSGGVGNLPYRVSFGFTDQNGILKSNDYQRYTLSFNLNPTFLEDHLTVNMNGKGMYSTTNFAKTDAIGKAISMDPTKPVFDEVRGAHYGGYWQWPNSSDWGDDSWNGYGVNTLATDNPVAALNNHKNTGKSKEFVGNIELDYKLHGFEDLHLHVNAGMDAKSGKSNKAESPYSYDSGNYYFGSKGKDQMDTYNLSLNAFAQYIKELSSEQNLDVMAGYEWQRFHKEKSWDYPVYYPSTHNTLAGQLKDEKYYDQILCEKTENFLVSFFGRANYSLMDRYLFTLTVRADGSSRFAKEERWGIFPSAAFAWKIKNENFLSDVDAVSDAKVRLGWGMTGQQEGIGDYLYLPTYTVNKGGAYYPVLGDGVTYRPDAYNKELTWEKTTTYNAGFDLALFNERVVLNMDYYYRNTTDLINNVVLPVGTNFKNKINRNIGALHNSGVETAITLRPIEKKNFRWELNYNVTWNKNEIDELVGGNNKNYKILHGGLAVGDSGSDGIKAYMIGHPVSAYYVYQQVYGADGQPIQGQFVDRNGDGQITGEDRYFFHQADPVVTMGLSNKFIICRNWDLGFSMRASIDNYVYNSVEANNSNMSYTNRYSGNTWHNVVKLAKDKNYQDVQGKDALSDYFMQNASFLKLDNITVGYSFSNIAGLNISGRVYATAQNIFTITNYKGIDPEISGGYDSNIYPRPFTGILGLSLNF